MYVKNITNKTILLQTSDEFMTEATRIEGCFMRRAKPLQDLKLF